MTIKPRTPTADEIADALKRPRDFGYWGGNDQIFKTWSIGPVIRTRDSDILQESNADALERALEEAFPHSADYRVERFNHWAVGWVEHLSFRAVTKNGTPTSIFAWILGWQDALDNYPVADEEDFSRRELDATLENIHNEGHGLAKPDAEDWESAVYTYLSEHNQRAVEPRDGGGGYPSREEIHTALEALNLLEKQ